MISKRSLIIIISAVVLLGYGIFLNQAAAYDINSNVTPVTPVAPGNYQPAENLISPITNFINTIKQISVGLIPRTGINFGSPRSIFNQAGNWFHNETGFRLGDIFKKIGALLIYLLTAVTDLLKWAVEKL